MTEWKEYKLGEIISIASGFAYKGEYIGEGDSFLLGMGCVSYKEKFLYSGARPYAGDCAERYYAKAGDIVLATRQQSDNLPILGMPAIIPEELKDKKLIVGANLYRVINNSDFDNKYLYWLLKTPSYVKHIASCKTGTTVAMITKADIENFVFVAPDKQERERILETISSLDDKIDLLHRENATLEQMAETLFRQWFVVEAKEEWEEGKLGDIVDVKSGFAFKSSSFVDFGLYRLITIKAVQDGFLTLENADYISEIPDNIKDYCLLKEGDILLSLTGNVGRCCLVDRERLLLNQRVALLCAKDNNNWAFVYTLFRMQSMKSKLEEMAKGTAQPNLSPIELSNMQFEIPPTKLLEGFSDAATPLLKKALSNNKQIQALIQMRDGLLPRLMGGEVKIL